MVKVIALSNSHLIVTTGIYLVLSTLYTHFNLSQQLTLEKNITTCNTNKELENGTKWFNQSPTLN